MELLPPFSASLGAMVSLEGKLDALHLDTELEDEVKKLKTRLVKLSKARDPPATVSIWMNDMRELSYDMDNCVDVEEDWIDQMPGFKALVKEANGRFDRYIPEIVPSPTDVVQIGRHQLLTVDSGRKLTDLVVGLHGEGGMVDRLCHLLTDGDEQLKVLSIVGVGGIGKTTLAKQLWHKHKPGDHFHCRAFVRMAKKPDMRRILRSILAQVRPEQPPDANEVHELIHALNKHLQNKRYFLIIDELWATSVWDVASRALPKGNHGSRIITATENEGVALACCSYQSKCIFEMVPLSDSQSEQLLTSAFLKSGEQYSRQLKGVIDEIIRRCAGLPQAIITISSVLAIQGQRNSVQYMEQLLNNLPTDTTPDDILKQVLKFCYNCLPSCLQTCLLYLSLYPDNYMILKEDIVKQWIAEGFILAPTENDKMEVAGTYFDKLVNMGMIQHIDLDYSDEVLYYAVHHTVHDIITSNSIEENFVTAIDYSQRSLRFTNNVCRLSLQFGSATDVTKSDSIGLLQIRSLAFIGLKSCFPLHLEFKFLRILILHIWDDQPSTGFKLGFICELVLLKYLQVTCNGTVHLPDLMQGPEHLETLEINATVAAIPTNIVHLRRWLHLRLGIGTELPDVTGTLKNATLNPPISLDESSSLPNSVKTIQLFQPVCRIPRWIGQLTNLCILKIVVRELQRDDIKNLQRLPLTFLSVHAQRTEGLIGFAAGAFAALEYFEFRCGVLRLMFQSGTMPNLQRLRLGFNAHRGEQYGRSILGIDDLPNVQEISAIIGVTTDAGKDDFEAAESAFMKAFRNHHGKVSVKKGDMLEEDGPTEKRGTDASSEEPEIATMEPEVIQSPGDRGRLPAHIGEVSMDSLNTFKDMSVQHAREELEALKRILSNPSEEPIKLSYRAIENITRDFTVEIGRGHFGVVYLGSLPGGKIAVKKLFNSHDLDDEVFMRVVNCLIRAKHENIVRFLGYCADTEVEMIKFNPRFVLALQPTDVRQRIMCFEYVPNGNLYQYLQEEPSRDEWHIRFQIIRGICEGLNYLQKYRIIHLDLKPENVMLDTQMKPKIKDFGLSRMFDEGQSRIFTQNHRVMKGYMAPELIYNGVISLKTDIFSLGFIIIKLLTGRNKYDLENWQNLLDVDGPEVKTCIEIAQTCLQADQHKRPTVGKILHELNELQNVITKTRNDTTSYRYQNHGP